MSRAEEICALVPRIRHELAQGGVAAKDIENWEAWALGEANKIDPVVMGQYLAHLHPPQLEGDDA